MKSLIPLLFIFLAQNSFASSFDGLWIEKTNVDDEYVNEDQPDFEVSEYYQYIQIKITNNASACSAIEGVILNGSEVAGSSLSCDLTGDKKTKSITLKIQDSVIAKYTGSLSLKNGKLLISRLIADREGKLKESSVSFTKLN